MKTIVIAATAALLLAPVGAEAGPSKIHWLMRPMHLKPRPWLTCADCRSGRGAIFLRELHRRGEAK